MREHRWLWLTLCGLLRSGAVHAEEAKPPSEAPASDAARSEQPGAPSAADLQAAQTLFTEGMSLFDKKQYAEAIESFRKSYDRVKSPNSLLMLARCLRRVERVGEAYDEYQASMKEASELAKTEERYVETARAAQEEWDKLRAEVALVTVKTVGNVPVPEGASLTVQGRSIDPNGWGRPVAAPPGKLAIVFFAPMFEKQELSVEVAAGGSADVTVPIEPVAVAAPPAPPPPTPREDEGKKSLRTGAYIAGGVGLTGLLTFGVVVIADGSNALLFTSLGVGAAGIGTGFVLYAVSIPSSSTSAHTSAGLVVGPRSVGVVGRF